MAPLAALRAAAPRRAQHALRAAVPGAGLAGSARHPRDADHRGAGSRNRHHADGFRRGGHEPETAGQRTHQPHAARDQLRRHPGAAAAGPDRLGDAADRRQIGLHGLAQHDRGGGSRRRCAVRPARFRGVEASRAHDQRARGKPGRKTARTADRAGHRRHRLHRQPPGRGPERRGPSGHRAGAQPCESRHAAAADHADHQPRSAPGGHQDRRDRQSRGRADRQRAVDRSQAPQDPRLPHQHDRRRRRPDRAARTQAGGAGLRLRDRLVRAVAGSGADRVRQVPCLLQP